MAVNTSSYYNQLSPYAKTTANKFYLDVINFRAVAANDEDVAIQLPTQYHHRPDLLSQDAYGTPDLWWVFAVRNPDTIRDPVFDLVSGMTVIIPKKSTLLTNLGSN
jgi:hypothetical protein